jgi:hypothetical protein
MANRLRQSSARVSFFAFQDMITTVTGVLMIVMLLLSLEVGQRVADAAALKTSQAPVREELDEARQRLGSNAEVLRQRRAELSALHNRVFVMREEDRSGKSPVLVALSATQGSCSRLGQTNLLEFPVGGGNGEFRKLLERLNPRIERLVFYVRPSGIAVFDACRALAEQRGFTIGYDAAEEDKNYVLTSQ